MAKKIMKKAAKAVKKVAKKAVKKMAKMPAMKSPSMQPSIGGPGAMGGGAPMMKKGGKMMKKVKKAQNGVWTSSGKKAQMDDFDRNEEKIKKRKTDLINAQTPIRKGGSSARPAMRRDQMVNFAENAESIMKNAKRKGNTLFKKGGKLKKAQTGGKYTMKQFKKEFPKADTMPSGDLRFEDLAPLNRYDKKDQKFIMSSQRAFNTKYGPGKPATSPKKNKLGGKVEKKKLGGKVTKAQNGIKKGMDRPYSASYLSHKKLREASKEAESKYNTSTTPKVEYSTKGRITPVGNFPSRRVSIDTQGLASGARRFPVKISGNKGDTYYQTTRKQVNKVLKNKIGGKTSKKK